MTGRLSKRLARIEAAAQAREAADDTKLKDYAKVFARARLHLSGRGEEEAGDLTAEDMAAARVSPIDTACTQTQPLLAGVPAP